MAKRLVLFDIDGTLLHCGSSARESLSSALSEFAGEELPLELEDVAGSTDLGIMRTALSRASSLDGKIGEYLPQIAERYLEILRIAYPARGDQYLYPGVREILEVLKSREDVRLGLLTGNLREGARVKLEPFGIWEYFSLGAFGSDSEDRNALPEIAWRRAEERYGEKYGADQTVLVGDTPRDAACAEVNEIRAVIICRRERWLEEIRRYDVRHIFTSTEEVPGIIRGILDD